MNFEKTFAHLKTLASTLSAKQLAGLIAAFVGVVGIVIASAYWISAPEYTLLVADMDAETASSVVSRLKDADVKYELTDGGRAVRVDASRVDELRLQFASDGLPSAGRIGFEIFDRPAFGTTEFLEHVNYRRALEGELARTIAMFSEISSARVHIAMAKDSLFVEQTQPAKSSVVLKLKNNRPLGAATARGIANLVAGSVEALRPEAVTIIDTFGRPLTKLSEDDAPMSGAHFDRQQQIERDLTNKVVALLEPVVGPGRVRVNVSAVLRTDIVEQTEEHFDPATIVRSRQTSFEASTSAAANGGVAGARANQPPALSTSSAPAPTGGASVATEANANTPPATSTTPDPASPPPATGDANTTTSATGTAIPASTTNTAANPAATPPAGSTPSPYTLPSGGVGSSRSSETTNYEVGRTTRRTVSPQGALARLSVAVMLDDERVTTKTPEGAVQTSTKPWEPAGLQRIQNLVTAAVGLDPKRGDQLTVENISFEQPIEEPAAAPVGFGGQALEAVKTHWPSALRGLAILLIASFAIFGVLRPIAKQATALAAPPALPAAAAGAPAARLPTVQEMEGSIDAELDAARAGQPQRLPVLTKRVAKLASDEPEQLARIVRGWIAEEQAR